MEDEHQHANKRQGDHYPKQNNGGTVGMLLEALVASVLGFFRLRIQVLT